MNASFKYRILPALLAAVAVVVVMATGRLEQANAQREGAASSDNATATVTVIVPADATVYFNGDLTSLTGTERRFTTPALQKGKKFHYNVLARWTENGKTVERTRKVNVTAGTSVRVSFVEDPTADKTKPKRKEKDTQVVTSKPVKRVPARTINFNKEYGLPFDSLGTLGSRIDAARRKPDPVALAHAAGELKVAEKVSGKTASLTSKALLAESKELAALRRQVAEMRAVFAVHQQTANEETDVNYWNTMIGLADKTARQERDAVLRNEFPTDAPRRVLVNNYSTQYIDLWVNGNYKMQIQPGSSAWCVIEHKWDPTILTGYGDEDDSATWGPRYIYGDFQTYTWNIEG
jgi:uncharacterized protein (TIGR03000 family)